MRAIINNKFAIWPAVGRPRR